MRGVFIKKVSRSSESSTVAQMLKTKRKRLIERWGVFTWRSNGSQFRFKNGAKSDQVHLDPVFKWLDARRFDRKGVICVAILDQERVRRGTLAVTSRTRIFGI